MPSPEAEARYISGAAAVRLVEIDINGGHIISAAPNGTQPGRPTYSRGLGFMDGATIAAAVVAAVAAAIRISSLGQFIWPLPPPPLKSALKSSDVSGGQ